MIDYWIRWDWRAFECVNQIWTCDLFDVVLPFVRQSYFWLPVYVFILSYSFLSFGRRAVPFLIGLVFVFFYTDLVTASMLKPLVERIRPCNASEDVRLLVNCGVGYSLPSAHASNHFGVSFYLFFMLRQNISNGVQFLIVFWAFLVAYAQVYVGVHFPGDVIIGGLLGILVARIVSWYTCRSDIKKLA